MDFNVTDETWQDLLTLDYDFDSETNQRQPEFFHTSALPESHSFQSEASEQLYPPFAQISITDESWAVPSVLEEYCSSQPDYYTASPLNPIITSPSDIPANSFYACHVPFDEASHSSAIALEPPILDTRSDRILNNIEPIDETTTTNSILNPHFANSACSFSSLDVRTSQLLLNADERLRLTVIEPVAEDADISASVPPISIPNSSRQATNTQVQSSDSRSQAVTIPQPSRAAVGNRSHPFHSHMLRRASPRPSDSTLGRRQSQSSAPSRDIWNNDRESRRKSSVPSSLPDSLGWISYSADGNNRLALSSSEGNVVRISKGRKKALTSDQRTQAALMRSIGACTNCQRRKGKCDPGTPCKSCLTFFKGGLIYQPCRNRRLSELSASFLSDNLGWHPTARSLESIYTPNTFNISTGMAVDIPVSFGFGQSLSVAVHLLDIQDVQDNQGAHDHVIYTWPPGPQSHAIHIHAVLPAVLTKQSMRNLSKRLDQHLAYLVCEEFNTFPLFCSPLQILHEVHIFFCNLPAKSHQARLLHQALKLLVLIHVGGDITLPPRSENKRLDQFICQIMEIPSNITPTPCLIRAQFGSIEPGLARHLMTTVLTGLEHLLLNRAPADWPVSLAVLLTVLMTIESIHYHAAKLPYHHGFDLLNPQRASSIPELHEDEDVKTLFSFYNACYSGCHARLRPEWAGDVTIPKMANLNLSPGDAFIEGVRAAMDRANDKGYLAEKTGKGSKDDIGRFFDTLVVRLLIHGC